MRGFAPFTFKFGTDVIPTQYRRFTDKGFRVKIAVAGAGIGGLTAAGLLADLGHDITVFDQFDAPRPVGSGLVIQPVGQSVLRALGAWDMAASKGAKVRHMLGLEAESGRTVLDVRYDRNDAAAFGLAIHRAALFDAIMQAAMTRPIRLEQSCKIKGINQDSDGATLYIDGAGSAGPFDLVIDATGVNSPLSPLRSVPLPYGAIWGTVDWPDTDLPADQLSQRYRRADRMIGALPIGSLPGETVQKAAIFWSLPRDAHADWQAAGLSHWKDEAITLWPDFAPFIDQITDPTQMTMANYSHGTLRRPYDRRLVHIGDAAHRTSPQLGQGANMALLDAMALARALADRPLQNALPAYARARRWHVGVYQTFSRVFTPQYQSDSRLLPILRDRLLFPLSTVPPIPRILTSLVCGTMLPPLGSLGPLEPGQTAKRLPTT